MVEEIHQINRQIKRQIKEQISDLGLDIILSIKNFPGIKVPDIFELLAHKYENLNLDKIRYSLKIELKSFVELRGSKKTGGYYLKEK